MDKKIKITKDGPYIVSGNIPLDKQKILSDDEMNSLGWEKEKDYPAQENYALCRCGKSKNKPFCDGNHIDNNFNGTETATKEPYLKQAETINGPDLILTDCNILCASAKFCHDKTSNTWDLTRDSGNPKSKDRAIKQACNCPAGRLVACDKKTGKPIEPELKQSICITKCPEEGVNGPIYVRGSIPIESSDGTEYEKRNRVTLCCCGKSENKPFCDGSHLQK
jgi:CDGSH-type Zn-finger protein